MIPSGLKWSVIHRARLGAGYVRVRDGGVITAVAQFLYDEAALLDERRLDEWLALFQPEAARCVIPSPEDLSDDPATTLHLVNDSMTTLAGRIGRQKSKHAHPESPRSRTRRQIANVRVWRGPGDLLSRSVFDVTRVRGRASSQNPPGCPSASRSRDMLLQDLTETLTGRDFSAVLSPQPPSRKRLGRARTSDLPSPIR